MTSKRKDRAVGRTFSMPQSLLDWLEEYAKTKRTSPNALVRTLIEQERDQVEEASE